MISYKAEKIIELMFEENRKIGIHWGFKRETRPNKHSEALEKLDNELYELIDEGELSDEEYNKIAKLMLFCRLQTEKTTFELLHR